MISNTKHEVLNTKDNKLDEEVCHCVGSLQDIKVILVAMDSKYDRILSLLPNKAKNVDSHKNNVNQNLKWGASNLDWKIGFSQVLSGRANILDL